MKIYPILLCRWDTQKSSLIFYHFTRHSANSMFILPVQITSHQVGEEMEWASAIYTWPNPVTYDPFIYIYPMALDPAYYYRELKMDLKAEKTSGKIPGRPALWNTSIYWVGTIACLPVEPSLVCGNAFKVFLFVRLHRVFHFLVVDFLTGRFLPKIYGFSLFQCMIPGPLVFDRLARCSR